MKYIYIFFPTTETHFDNFLPLYKKLRELNELTILISVEDTINVKRKYKNSENVPVELHTIHSFKGFIESCNSIPLLFVGNDSEPNICKVIWSTKKVGGKTILVQDGWLESKNINNPIFYSKTNYRIVKKYLHKFLASKISPIKKYIHNFIGQNADYFFVYSKKAQVNFINAGIKKEKIYLTGSPRHHLMKTKGLKDNKKKAIVFFSRSCFNQENESGVLVALDWILKFFSPKSIVIKPHPSEDLAKYNEILLKNSNIQLYLNDSNNLIEQYNIEFAFCFNSTVIFDMLTINVPIIQLAPNNFITENFNYHMELPLAKNYKELVFQINNYNLEEVIKTGENYLLDINKNFNSIDKTIDIIKKIEY